MEAQKQLKSRDTIPQLRRRAARHLRRFLRVHTGTNLPSEIAAFSKTQKFIARIETFNWFILKTPLPVL